MARKKIKRKKVVMITRRNKKRKKEVRAGHSIYTYRKIDIDRYR